MISTRHVAVKVSDAPFPAVSGSACVAALKQLGFVVHDRAAGLVRMSKGEVEVAVPLTLRLAPIVVRCILLRAAVTEQQFLRVLGQLPTP